MSSQMMGEPGLGPEAAGDLAAAEQRVAENWGWFVALGVLLIVLGALAVANAVVVTLAVVTFCGVLFLFGAGAHVVTAFSNRDWAGFMLELLLAAFLAVAGTILLVMPVEGALIYTLFLGMVFLFKGAVRVGLSFMHRRFMGWLVVLLSGVVSLLLGGIIIAQWPISGLFVIGLLIGIDLMMSGASWAALGLTARQHHTPQTHPTTPAV